MRGPAQVGVQVSPRARVVPAQVDDRPLAVVGENAPLTIDTTTLPDGRHRVPPSSPKILLPEDWAEASLATVGQHAAETLTVDSQPTAVGEGQPGCCAFRPDDRPSVEATLDGRPLPPSR